MSPDLKKLIDTRLQHIANVLLLNASFIDNLGLLNGKMGIAIFFYHYARYTGDEIYERYAGELIDEIYAEIHLNTPVDFENGLTGIGWGIEYLVFNGFVEADTDETLAEIDNVVFRTTMQTPISIQNQTDLFGFGLFYLSRLKGREYKDDDFETLKKKQLSIYLMDECERILTKDILLDVSVPKLTLYQANSLFWFIMQTRILGLFPAKSDKLVKQMADYAETKIENEFDSIDRAIFCRLTDKLMPLIRDTNLHKRYEQLRLALSTISNTEPLTDEKLSNKFIKSGWCPLLYELNFPVDIIEETEKDLTIITNKEGWNQRLENLNKDNMGMDKGLAGLGITLLNEAKKENKETKKVNGLKILTKSHVC